MRRTRVLVLLLALVLLAAAPGVATAEERTGNTVTVGENETIEDDLEASGGSVVVHGTVDGDLQAGAGTVLVFGTVTGDVEAGAGSITIGGDVGGDVEAGGGSVTIDGDVDGDVQAGGGTVHVTDRGQINGSLEAQANAGNSPIESGDSRIVVNGTVDDDARLVASEIRLGPNATIRGNLTYAGDLTRADGSTVEGAVTRDDSLQVDADGWLPELPGPAIVGYGTLATLLLGGVLLRGFPTFSAAVTDRIAAEPVRTGAYGVGFGIGVPIALVLVFITIIGIPLSLAGAILFALGLWAGAAYGRYAVGVWLCSWLGVENRWAALVLGVFLVAFVSFIPLLGQLVETTVLLLGAGALVIGLFERYRARGETETRSEPITDPA